MDDGGNVEGEGERKVGEHGGDVVGLRDEDGVRCAFEAGEDVCAKVLYSVNFQSSDF